MTRINANVPTDLHRQVKAEAALAGVTIPEMVAILLDEALRARRAKR